MKMLTESEHAELIAARDERDRLIGFMSGDAATGDVLLAGAEALVAACDREGFVLTVQQWSVPPLAMGRYKTVATLRRARGAE